MTLTSPRLFDSSKIAFVVAALAGALSSASAETIELPSAKDNTLIQAVDGGNSNALGDAIYCGRTGIMAGYRRLRPAIMFDVSDIPPGSKIDNVTLRLYLIQTNSGNHTITLHRLLNSWGEGSSFAGGGVGSEATKGDATWLHRYYPDVYWQNEGGDFDETILATTIVGNVYQAYSWSQSEMAAVVQSWLDDPETNHGWLLKGNEAGTRTAKKFASRDHASPELHPVLIVEYSPTPTCAADIVKDGNVNVNDLLAVINSWGACAGNCPPSCDADVAPAGGDCVVNVNDLLAVINSWGSCP